MYEEMNQELEKLHQGMQLYNKKASMLDDLKKQLNENKEKEALYRKELEKEESDVEKFNRKGLTNIFYTLLGAKEERENKERQEALAAYLKLDEVIKQIEIIENNILKLEEEKNEVKSCESQYKILYQKKYEILKASGREEAEKILKLEENIAFTKSNLKEIGEAIAVGKRILDRVSDAESSLSSAKNWGTLDLWGGGLMADMAKHSHIDDAVEAVSHIQGLLSNFRSELADVKIQSNIDISINGFTKFADFFFDGLIADWAVQSNINKSLETVYKVKIEVESVVRKLEAMEAGEKGYISKYSNDLKNMVENAR